MHPTEQFCDFSAAAQCTQSRDHREFMQLRDDGDASLSRHLDATPTRLTRFAVVR